MKIIFRICSIILSLFVAIVLSLWIAGPQSNKWSYRLYANYQYYAKYGYDDSVPVPQNFTGIWKVWKKNGTRSECQFVDGDCHGKIRNWDKNDKLWRETFWDETDYRERHWIDGKEVSDGVFRRAEPWYGSFWIRERNPDTTHGAIDYFLDGQKVTAEAYGKWVKDTGGIPELLKQHPEIKR